MPDIHITIRNKIASGSGRIVLDNTDYSVVFSFDEEWAEYPTKTMRVSFGTEHIDTIFEGDTVLLPRISGAGAISIGVYAGDIRTTTPALILCRDSILTAGGSPAAPPEDVYAQIMEKLNSIEGGEISPEQIAAAVEQYLEENPVEAVTEHDKLSGKDAADQHPITSITGLQAALDGKQPAFSKVRVTALSSPIISTSNGEGYGTCIVIHNDNTCIVFDLGYDKADEDGSGQSKTLIKYLSDNNILTINTLFISHYHADHIRLSAIQDILNNSISIKKIVLPHGNIEWDKVNPNEQYLDLRNNVVLYAEQNGIDWIEPASEGHILKYDNIKVTCFNVDAAVGDETDPGAMYDYYFNWPYDSYYRYKLSEGETSASDVPENNYNNFSMVNVVELAGQKIVIAGDIMEPAQKNMADVLSAADLLFVPHHGLDTMIAHELFNRLHPKYAVISSAYDASEMLTKYASRAFASELLKNGCEVMTTYDAAIVACQISESGIEIIEHGIPASGNLTACAIRPDADLDSLPDGEYITNYEWQTQNLQNKPAFQKPVAKFRLSVETTSYNTLERSQTAYNIDTSYTPEIARRNMVGATLQSGVWHPWAVMKIKDIIDDGTIYIPSSESGYSTVQFLDKNGKRYCSIQGRQSDHKVSFFMYPTDDNGYYENYILPFPDTGLSENKFYNILTEKTPMTPKTSTVSSFTSNATPVDNTLYILSVSSAITISASSASACPLYGAHFIITFKSGGTITLNCLSVSGDDIQTAASGDVWEVSILRGRAIVKKMNG